MKNSEPLNLIIFIPVLLLICCVSFRVQGQTATMHNRDTVSTVDLIDVLGKVLKIKKDTSKIYTVPEFTLFPLFGYNPSFGFVIGTKLSTVRQFGTDRITNPLSFSMEAIYSTKGVVKVQARHNVFTKWNKWNIQGNLQLSKFLIADYGLGPGHKDYQTNSDSTFLIRFAFIKLTEKIYRKIGKNLYAGGGISFDIRNNINDQQLVYLPSTPHNRYSLSNGFNPQKYSANGFLLALQYNSPEHTTRSYGGFFADVNLRFNQRWIGSTKNSIQLQYDFKKYMSLSKNNPEHVLSFWHWASYKLWGILPYLELPATGYDTYNRSGRAYTIGRFKGPSYTCFETEWRFPITRNKLVGGVVFVNFQSASDDFGKKLFQFWETAGGGGLRILFQKNRRSTICIDYAKGKYGSGGFFIGFNEAF